MPTMANGAYTAAGSAAGNDPAGSAPILAENEKSSLAVPMHALRATPTSANADALVCLWELRRLAQ